LKALIDERVSPIEAKHVVMEFFAKMGLENDLVLEIAASLVGNYLDLFADRSLNEIDAILSRYIDRHGEPISQGGPEIANVQPRDIVFRWFGHDVMEPGLKAIAELFPEIDSERLEQWKGTTIDSLAEVLDGILSFDDFEKRVAGVLKSSALEFDIETITEHPNDEEELPDKFIDIENRGSALEAIIASAELVYQEWVKDPTLEAFAAALQRRQRSLDRMYM
jgi:hypothetical protein